MTKRRKGRNCIYCLVTKKEKINIEPKSIDYRMVAIERPYANLFFHTDCYNKFNSYDKLNEFIVNNFDYIFDNK